MSLQRQPVNGNQSPSGHCGRPTPNESGISKCLQSFTDTALITKRFAIKRDAGLSQLHRGGGRQIEKPKD